MKISLTMRFIYLLLIMASPLVSAFMTPPTIGTCTAQESSIHHRVAMKANKLNINDNEINNVSVSWQQESTKSRRNFGKELLLATAAASTGAFLMTTFALPANAIPMISTDEFTIILRDSARSIVRVEFFGVQNDQVEVLLTDGTRFGLNDVVESSVDPRSPLKIAALCRENGVPTKFVNLEAALAKAPKRTKSYANARVQEAAQKEKEKMARMQQDEQDRLAALADMQAKQGASQ